MTRGFPAGFRWGTATAAFQIEGSTTADGRGPSIWDTFAARPGRVLDGATGDPACDHYRRYREDVGLLRELGVPYYRFSVAWSRVMPDGRTIEPRGLAFYDRLVDTLLEHGITPMITLYHWDLPQALEDEGGWPNRNLASLFADYTLTVHKALGDRVRQWTTINEPFCAAFIGYGNGDHAPGLQDEGAAVVAGHNLMLAHGLAAQVLRDGGGEQEVSIVLNFAPVLTDVDDAAHREAARKFDFLHNRFFLDPLLGRGYPPELLADLAHIGTLEPAIADGDLELIAQPLDILGVNYYAPARAIPLDDPEADSNCPLPGLRGMDVTPPRGDLTSLGWEQRPESLTDLLLWLRDHCPGLPLVIAENGAAFEDEVVAGRVHDEKRVRYFAEHLAAVHDAIERGAIERGADVRGYMAWSLLDNFEWAMGYTQRFGLVHVDFGTQERVLKDSARFYADVVARNGLEEVVTGPVTAP